MQGNLVVKERREIRVQLEVETRMKKGFLNKTNSNIFISYEERTQERKILKTMMAEVWL